MPTPTDAEFTEAWLRMDSSTEMAEHFGCSRIAIRVRATWLRKKGVKLPYHDQTRAQFGEEQRELVRQRRLHFAEVANGSYCRQDAAAILGITPDSYSAMASVYRKLGYDIKRFEHPWLEWED